MVRTPAKLLLEKASSLPQIFDVVKEVVRRHLRTERGGLMLGLSNLGMGDGYLVGGFFQVAGNMIVMNKYPLLRIQATHPGLYKPFSFHILLHEYLHSIGYLDEASTRQLTFEISRKHFGPHHPVTELSMTWRRVLGELVYPEYGWQPQGEFAVEVVRGFDLGSTGYIQ